jgi:hypothetical protein
MQVRHNSQRLAVLLIILLSSVVTPQVQPTKSARSLIDAFDDALFVSTRDRGGYGQQAIDLYWEADGYTAGALNSDFYQKLRHLYNGLTGDHLVRVSLSDAGWTIKGPSTPLIVAKNQQTGVLIVVGNQTLRPQTVSLEVSGQSVAATKKQLTLDPSETAAVVSDVCADSLGSFQANISVSGERETSVALHGEVRTAVPFHLQILDANGHETPARVYVRANGISETPLNAFDRAMWITGEHFFYTRGSAEMILPAGKTRIEVRKGFDYQPIIREIDLSPANATMEMQLKWLRNMNASGWYSGDDHIHGNYIGEQWTTPADDFLTIRSEGLNIGNMLVSNSVGGTIHDERFFEGQANTLSNRNEIMRWNQELRTWSYGHLLFLNLKQLVRPLYTGFPDTEHWEDYPSNYRLEQQGRTQSGIALYAHPALKFGQIPSGSRADELAIDVVLHGIDAMEVFSGGDEPSMELWYGLLNLGFRLGISAGSDAFLNRHFAPMAGGERVYVYTGHEFSDVAWSNGLRRGRSFATVAPLLDFKVDKEEPGAEKHFASGPVRVSVRVNAVSSIPFNRIEVVANGKVVAQVSSPNPTGRLEWSGTISLNESSWLAARVWAPDNDRVTDATSRWAERRVAGVTLAAHTSPVYITMNHRRIFSKSDRDFFLHWVDVLTERINKEGKFSSNAHRAEVITTFANARRAYEALGRSSDEVHRQLSARTTSIANSLRSGRK